MKLVLDATPLIYLVRAGFHTHLHKLGVELFTTKEVLEELGLEDKGYPENNIISGMIEDGAIKVLKAEEKLPKVKGIHRGELSVIALAREIEGIVIIDDRAGKVYARTLGIKSFHSTFLIFLAVKRGILSKEEAKNIVDYMIDSGWRCDVETYRNILRVLQRL
jgi:predicted nucleic acid-binding protein